MTEAIADNEVGPNSWTVKGTKGSGLWSRAWRRTRFKSALRDMKPSPTASRLAPNEVVAAWEGLRTHPILVWVPPMWRSVNGSAGSHQVMRKRAVCAIEANLRIELNCSTDGRLLVRLATGALTDRTVAGGVDPVVPAASLDPKLDVTASTFEDAVVALYGALIEHYGDAGLVGSDSTASKIVGLRRKAV